MSTAVTTHRLAKLAIDINAEIRAAEASYRKALDHAVRVGQLLIEAKALVNHGEWLPWLEANCAVKRTQAEKYMRLARANYHPSGNLTITEAVAQLTAPKVVKPDPNVPSPDVRAAIVAKAGRGEAQRDIAKTVGAPITTVAQVVADERAKATSPSARRRTAAKAEKAPTLTELDQDLKEAQVALKNAVAAHRQFAKTGDVDQATTAGRAATAASMSATLYANQLAKYLNHTTTTKEPTT